MGISFHSHRSGTRTSVIIYLMDINSIAALGLLNLINSIISIHGIRRVNHQLNRIDFILNQYNVKSYDTMHSPRIKRNTQAVVIVSFILYAVILGEFWSRR